MWRESIRPAGVLLGTMTLLLGVAYPAVVTGIAQVALPFQANGSILRTADGAPVASALLGQPYTGDQYLLPRPSATGAGPYDGAASTGSNLGPTNPLLDSLVRSRVSAIRQRDAVAETVPADLATASGSGLDPEISPASAALQVERIARARGVSPAQVEAIVTRYTAGRTFGVLGEPRVNVVRVNLALDSLPNPLVP
jgi:K+-transporting ATPase ATPase C chain